MSNDQAKNLRELIKKQKRCKTLFFASGRERVGKTMITTNLASLLSKNDYKTLLLDSGSGFFRSDVVLGTMPKYGIKSIINSSGSIDDVVVSIDDNLDILYIRTVFEAIKESKSLLEKLKEYLDKLKDTYDFILVDLEELDIRSIKDILDEDSEITFVLCAEDLNCLTPTYSIIKEIESYTDIRDVNIILNKVQNEKLANVIFERLKTASEDFLKVRVSNIGYISNDSKISGSFKEQVPITILYEECEVSKELKNLFTNIILSQSKAGV